MSKHEHTQTSESEFVRHLPCETCGSSDANSLYSDGHTFCFACQTYGHTEEVVHNHRMSTNVQLKGSAERLPKRGISEKVCQQYKIYRDGDVLRFHYFDSSGILKGCKVKTKNKVFSYEGEVPGTFFGQHLFPANGKRVVITEGELDAASCQEVMSGWPMVSLPSGAAAAKKSIQRNLEWLQGFSEIVLFYDNDAAGRKATEESASVLPPGKCKIASLQGDYKDASDALAANDPEAIRRAIWDAKPYRPDGIVDGKSLLEVVTTPSPPANHDYPFAGLNSKLRGIRYGELVTVTAGSGVGKSSVCRELATHLLQKGERVGYLALEESNRRTALGLMSAAVGKSLHLGEHERSTLTEAYNATLANWNLFLFDGFGSFDPDIVYNRIEYLACGLDTKVIFLDHLSILLSGLDGDERRIIDQTMTRLRSLVERTGIAMFLVSHLRRTSSDQNHEEGARVTLGQLRGSAAIAQLSDGVIALERNQQSASGGSDTTVRVLKNRYSGEVGIACRLSYDLSTCKFYETEAEDEFDVSEF
jgi:twinkle protein